MKFWIYLFFSFCCSINRVSSQEIYFDWASSYGGIDTDAGHDVTVLNDGSVVVVGKFYGAIDFDPGVNEYWLHSADMDDAFIARYDHNGNFLWAGSISNTDWGFIPIEWATAVTADADQNIYITGLFMAAIDADPGSAQFILTPQGERDIFIIKLDSAGNFIWANGFGGSMGRSNGTDLKISESGFLYLAGHYSVECDFDPSVGTTILTSGGLTPYVAKYDLDGNFIWVKELKETGWGMENYCLDMELDKDENIYLGGFFETSIDFDPGPGTYNLSCTGYPDMYVCKLNSDGDFIWASDFGSNELDWFGDLCLDNDGNVYVTGGFRGTGDYDPGSGILNITPVGWLDIVTFKLNSLGELVWINTCGEVDTDLGYSIAIDTMNNLIVSGTYTGIVDFDSGSDTYLMNSLNGNGFLQKLDLDGIMQWTLYQPAGKLFINPSRNIYMTGGFSDSLDFNPSDSIYQMTSFADADIFIVKLIQDSSLIEGPLPPVQDSIVITELKIYPVPTYDELYIDVPDSIENVIFFFVNTLGQNCINIVGTPGKNKIDVSGLADGIYFIKIEMDGILVEKTIVKAD